MKTITKLTLNHTHPSLCLQWHPTLNGSKKPSDFTSGSHQKIWWQCPIHKEDIYEAFIYNRAHKNLATMCPFCDGKKSNIRNCLFTTHNNLMNEWSNKNTISPKNICAGTNKKAIWICAKCDNEYISSIAHRANGTGCPYCCNNNRKISTRNSFSDNGILPNEWKWSITNINTPDKISYLSDKKANFTHNSCGKDTNFRIYASASISCQYCNSLGVKSPHLLKDWNYKLNDIDPFQIANGSGRKVHWICAECDYKWMSLVANRTAHNHGCMKCSIKNRTKTNEKFDKELSIKNIDVIRIEDYISDNIKITFKHLQCGASWKAKPNNILNGSGCPSCINKNETLIVNTLDKLGIQYLYQFKIKTPANKNYNKIDFLFDSINTMWEYNGVQHYQPEPFFSGGSAEKAKQKFIKQQIRDEAVRTYCEENKIKLLEIDGRRYYGNKLKEFVITWFKTNNPALIKNSEFLTPM